MIYMIFKYAKGHIYRELSQYIIKMLIPTPKKSCFLFPYRYYSLYTETELFDKLDVKFDHSKTPFNANKNQIRFLPNVTWTWTYL